MCVLHSCLSPQEMTSADESGVSETPIVIAQCQKENLLEVSKPLSKKQHGGRERSRSKHPALVAKN